MNHVIVRFSRHFACHQGESFLKLLCKKQFSNLGSAIRTPLDTRLANARDLNDLIALKNSVEIRKKSRVIFVSKKQHYAHIYLCSFLSSVSSQPVRKWLETSVDCLIFYTNQKSPA